MARIYNNLGFQQRGLVEGWNSVNTDPTNFSAHRFLSDSYSVLPRHEIARVSELLQSQLLQPTNIAPLQPQLAESNLLLISSQGPATAGFNTYNPLFNRNQATLQLNGLVGENSNWAGEGIVSGIYNKLSLSAGYSHFETDGWRVNADQDDNIANIFAQYELTYKTSIQAEYRYRDTEKGDLAQRFFEDSFRPNERQKDETNAFRLGFRHSFTPENILLGNFAYTNRDASLDDEFPNPITPTVNITTDDEKAYSGEIQYLFRSDYVNLASGTGYFNVNREDVINLVIAPPPIVIPPPIPGLPPIVITPEPMPVENKNDLSVNHTNLYLYSYIKFPHNVTWTLGASGDFFDSELEGSESRNQFNPKFGITWNPFPDTTLRAAVFRTLKRTLISDQTLEPTQVAGFNQFYDDPDATESWRYGGAIDQKFLTNFYGGLEFSYRDLEVPNISATTGIEERSDEDEYFGRAYLYWTPHKWWALSAEYQYERLERDEEFAFGVKKLTTHRVPFGINFFHSTGISASVRPTYYNQTGEFEPGSPGQFVEGDDSFWIVDLALSYRLPKRYGFVTVGATNLFDEKFKYYEIDEANPRIQSGRVIFGKITLSLP